jgi:tRNA dimethylallyltransferase
VNFPFLPKPYFAPVHSKEKTVIIIAGPTAVGKTSVGIAVARHFGAEIISADSRQCFKELNIGVARPSGEELAQVPHHFIASHSIGEKVTAATFEEYALAKAGELFQKNNVIVMVGGTGLYIKAFCEGMDQVPEVPPAIHEEVKETYKEKGMEWLQEEIRTGDPLFWERGEVKNPQRMMRALEVLKATGQSIFEFRKGIKKTRDFSVVKLGMELPKEDLHRNIAHRVDKMMEMGQLEEVRSLVPYQHLNALQTVGYRELFPYLNGEVSLPEAIEAIKQNTRQYAKRQMTWFKKDKEFRWLPPNADAVLTHLQGN